MVTKCSWWRDLAKGKYLVRSSVRGGQEFPQHEWPPEQQRQTHQKLQVCFPVSSRSGFRFVMSNPARVCASLSGNKISLCPDRQWKAVQILPLRSDKRQPGKRAGTCSMRWIIPSLGLARGAVEMWTLAQLGAHWWNRCRNVSYCLSAINFQPSAEARWLRSSPPLVAVALQSKAD